MAYLQVFAPILKDKIFNFDNSRSSLQVSLHSFRVLVLPILILLSIRYHPNVVSLCNKKISVNDTIIQNVRTKSYKLNFKNFLEFQWKIIITFKKKKIILLRRPPLLENQEVNRFFFLL